MIEWILIVSLDPGAAAVVDRYPTETACVEAAERGASTRSIFRERDKPVSNYAPRPFLQFTCIPSAERKQ